jgi:hypothetical protein
VQTTGRGRADARRGRAVPARRARARNADARRDQLVRPAGETAASVSYEADLTSASEGCLRLRFSTADAENGGRRQVDQRVVLATTRPGFGGARWWFVDDGRRVGQLHLVPGGDRFRSRRAYARAAGKEGKIAKAVVNALNLSPATAACFVLTAP